MTKILGIDPGSRVTGYGVINFRKNNLEFIDCGCIRLQAPSLSQRLKILFENLNLILQRFNPQEFAIEQVFMHKNPNSALKLGHARGVAMLAASIVDLDVSEYSPRQIKQSIVGYGGATKEQVQHMVVNVLKLNKTPQTDAADALSVAITHAHNLGQFKKYTPGIKKFNKGRLQ